MWTKNIRVIEKNIRKTRRANLPENRNNCSRYVALKFTVAGLTGKNNEIKIHRHLASQSGSHPGSEHVIALFDHFRVHGTNGEHDVLVLQVLGPHIDAMFDEEPSIVQQSIKSLVHQVALGTSFLHHCGVVHGGWSTVLRADRSSPIFLDLHQGNIAFEITRDQAHQTDLFPKYLVIPGVLVDCVKEGDTRVKILDLGEGSSRCLQLYR